MKHLLKKKIKICIFGFIFFHALTWRYKMLIRPQFYNTEPTLHHRLANSKGCYIVWCSFLFVRGKMSLLNDLLNLNLSEVTKKSIYEYIWSVLLSLPFYFPVFAPLFRVLMRKVWFLPALDLWASFHSFVFPRK